MAIMPKAIIEVECKHERECAVHSKFLLGIVRDALASFLCTQRVEDYPLDHWAQRAAAVERGKVRSFEEWWHNEGSGIGPVIGDDMESHARRVARAAWMAGDKMPNAALTGGAGSAVPSNGVVGGNHPPERG